MKTLWRVAICLVAVVAVLNASAAEREITFNGAGEVKLSATLSIPDSKSGDRLRFAAAVLVQGSGPTDRDGSQPPVLKIDLLKQVAEHLAAKGIATLRFDKRGQYRSAAAPKDEVKLTAFCAWDNYIGDVVAAYGALKLQPEIDPARIVFIGHSEGGLLAMHACKKLQDGASKPAAIVLLSTPGRRSDVVLRDQLKRTLEVQGASAEQTKFFLDKNDAITDAIRRTGIVPNDVPPGLRALYPTYLAKFWQGQLEDAPMDLIASLDVPVLVIQGDRDQQEAPADAPKLAAAAEHPAKLVMIAGASHNLKLTKDKDDSGIDGPIDPNALFAISDWLNSTVRNLSVQAEKK